MQRLNITLFPTNGRKSFYNKCEVLKDKNGVLYLRSYDTIVASYNPNSGIFSRIWSGYSQTTINHVNGFLFFLGLESINKNKWDNMSVVAL